MNANDTLRVRKLADGSIVQILDDGTTRQLGARSDWARVDALTEDEIEANALDDEDNPPLTQEELDRMSPLPDPRKIRKRLQLSQEQFASMFHLPLGTIRDWEIGRRQPDSAARTLLRVIDRDPEAVVQALNR